MEWDFDLETPDETVLDGSPGGLMPFPVYDALLENHGLDLTGLSSRALDDSLTSCCLCSLSVDFPVLLVSNPCVNVNLGEA